MKNISRLHSFVINELVGSIPTDNEYSRSAWIRLNCIRNGIGRYGYLMSKWGLTTAAAFDCSAEQQTLDLILYRCPIYNLTRKKWAIIIDQ